MKKNTVKLVTDNGKCTGCSLCYNICAMKAISMEIDKDGFYAPIIDFDKCNFCGRCHDSCPTISFKNSNKNNPKIYSGWTNNKYYLDNSSSGGIFPELANYFITNHKGIVYGAIWDNPHTVRHIGIEKTSDIKMLMSSKYLQSKTEDVFLEIKKLCESNRYVLFSGTPCQVAGLKNFVKSDKLFTVDLVCHGVPSKNIFLKYMQENKITEINFRDKLKGWQSFMIYTKKNKKDRYTHHRLDPFFYGYLENMYLQKICYSCPFSTLPRTGDISLGDYWGIKKKAKNTKGTSLMLTNNCNGDILLKEMIEKKLIKVESSSLSDASAKNPRLITGKLG
ncbi:MAG: Coenzyme F420 hydrogenase/dehydrogenase, beta subunit C-terminal domain, partial [Candidatus Cloacimonetes bacterium]|nr:Coenzyme F420 hydrogenase/dehydrogenase, beta subunit C-terminal domain [Candidatus Cloacimonadota bacterium]